MTIRIDVLEDQTIEIMRPHRITARNVYHKIKKIEIAMILIQYYISKDLESSNKNKFVSQATREARKSFRLLQEKSPYAKK